MRILSGVAAISLAIASFASIADDRDADSWPLLGRDWRQSYYSPLTDINADEHRAARLRLGLRPRVHQYAGSDAGSRRWSHVHERQCRAHLRAGCCDGRAALEVRADAGFQDRLRGRGLRLHQSRCRRPTGEGIRRRRRRLALCVERGHRRGGLESPDGRRPQPLLFEHRRSVYRRQEGHHRQRRRRVRRARLFHCLRYRNGQASLALLHRPRRSEEGLRTSRAEDGGQDLVAEESLRRRSRRHRVGRDGLRPRAESAVRRHG